MNKISKSFKNKNILIFGIALFIILVAIILVFTFVNKSNDFKSAGRNIYFINSATNEIVPEKRNIENGTQLLEQNKKNEYVNAVMNEFLNGPKNANLSPVIPENVSLKKCEFDELKKDKGVVKIDFSKEYNELSESQELACRSALVKTFTEIDFVESVDITSDGKAISRDNGQIVGDIKDERLEINPYIEPYKTDNRIVKLYFSDENAMGLCKEERNIEINEKQSTERKIVEELIKGPKNETLVAVIPQETKINNINTEGGICYVDLSKDFISQHNGGSTGELLTIYSIVNSLTELDYVKQVQFLIDGVKETSLAGHVDFSKTFERDESRILKEDY